ncbi:MAG: hypothetical protein AB1Z98_13980 [Nannocystaceae bacterium]
MKRSTTIQNPDHTTCIIFEESADARKAFSQLRDSGLERPARVDIHEGHIGQDQFTVRQSRSGRGALLGALAVGLPTSAFLAIASSSDVLSAMQPGMAAVVGLLGGCTLGVVAGMLAGVTEPPAFLVAARKAVRRGQVALVARFGDAEQAERASDFLLSRPGAVGAVRS